MYIYIYTQYYSMITAKRLAGSGTSKQGKSTGNSSFRWVDPPQVFSNSVWMVDGSSSLIPMAPWGDMNET